MPIVPLFLLLLLSPTSVTAQNVSRVRALDTELHDAIEEGRAHSAVFRELIAQIDASNVIVFVKVDSFMPAGIQGRLTFMSTAAGQRYVMVRIARGLLGAQQVAMIGHELRHAVEIADAESVVDQATLAAEYRRIGFESRTGHRDGFDSLAAIDTGKRVWLELSHHGE